MRVAGLPVENASKALKLVITKRDCELGDTKDPALCAAARACKRELGATEVRVHIGRVYVKTKDKWTRYITPKSLRTEIIAFDRGGKFEPGEYILGKIQPSKATGKSQGSPQTNRRSSKDRYKAPKRTKSHTVTGIRHHGANR